MQSRFLRCLLRTRLATLGLVVLVVVVMVAALASWLAPHDAAEIDVTRRLEPPGADPSFPLGTDHLGRDVLSRLVYGSRISLLVGLTSVAIAGTVGVLLGLISGYFGGRVDDIIMRITEIQLAFPFILLALAVLAVLGSGLRNIILVLGLTGWTTYARVVRGQVLAEREKEYVEAARALGIPSLRIMLRHVFPNVTAATIVIASFAVATNIIAEASLSFLGLGVGPDTPTWGSMLAEGREYIQDGWWLVTFPGLALMFTVLGINAFGDFLRDYLDPRLKNVG